MTVVERDGEWLVVEGDTVLARCATQADAWQWADGHSDDALADEDRRRRIQTAFAERLNWGERSDLGDAAPLSRKSIANGAGPTNGGA